MQTPQVFRRAALERALAAGDDVLARGHRRRVARRGAGRRRAGRAVAAGELQGHDAARPPGRRALLAISAVLTDYHVHLRPDDPDTARRRGLHDRQRRALPRGRRGARDRRARRLRARLPLPPGARRLGPPVLAGRGASTTSTTTAASSARTPTCALGIEADFVPGREDRHGEPRCESTRPATTSSARCTSSATRRSTTTATTSGRRTRIAPTRSGAATSRRSARPRERPVRHPRPPGPREGLGRGAARGPTATCAASTSWRWRASRRRGIAIEVSTAGLRKPVGEIYPARAFLEMCLDAGMPDRALQRRPRARARSATATRRRSSCSTPSASASSPCSRAASVAWSRSGERPSRPASATTRIASPPAGRSSSAGSRSRGDRGPRRALRRRRPRPRRDRRAARRGRPGRHRRALPRHRPALRGRGLDRAAARRRRAASAGREIVHVDATVLLERPKLGPYRESIRERLAGALARRPRPRERQGARPARAWASSGARRASPRWPWRRSAATSRAAARGRWRRRRA